MKDLVLGGADGRGLTHLRNLDTVADPGLARGPGRPRLVLGGMSGTQRVIHLHSATADPDGTWRITTEPDDPALATRLADPPPAGAWDATGYHCPCHVRGLDLGGAPVERIYYAGSASWESLAGPYSIGFLQRAGDRWVRHPEPVFTATEDWERDTVLEPDVSYRDGRWILNYTAGLADGTEPATACAESTDGVRGWRRTTAPRPGTFDAVAVPGSPGELLTSRHPLDGRFTREHGLWLGERQILRTADGTAWHDAGAWKPSAGAGEVYFTVAQRVPGSFAPALGIGRLRLRR